MSSTYLLDDLASVYLPAASISPALVFGTNLFAGILPDAPDDAVALSEYPGPPPQYLMGPNPLPSWEYPRVQLLVRHTDYHTGRIWIEVITRALESITNATVNTTSYLRVSRLTTPSLLHRDEKRRCFFVVNLECERRPS